MSVPEGRIVRIACDQTSANPINDYATGEPVVIWRGADVRIQGALFNGTPGTGTFVTDISNIVSIELAIRKHNVNGPIMVSKQLLQNELANSSWAAWANGTGQQFEFVLNEAQTSWDVLSGGSLPIFFTVTIITASALYVAGRGYGQIIDVGIVDVVAPFLPSNYQELEVNNGGTTNLVIVRGNLALRLIVSTGGLGTSFIYKLVLPIEDLLAGSTADISIEMSASDGKYVEVYNENVVGTLLHVTTSDMDNPVFERILFRFDQANSTWIKFGPAIS